MLSDDQLTSQQCNCIHSDSGVYFVSLGSLLALLSVSVFSVIDLGLYPCSPYIFRRQQSTIVNRQTERTNERNSVLWFSPGHLFCWQKITCLVFLSFWAFWINRICLGRGDITVCISMSHRDSKTISDSMRCTAKQAVSGVVSSEEGPSPLVSKCEPQGSFVVTFNKDQLISLVRRILRDFHHIEMPSSPTSILRRWRSYPCTLSREPQYLHSLPHKSRHPLASSIERSTSLPLH